MQLTTYLNFDRQCGEAFRFYHQVLGGELTVQTHGETPMKDHVPADWHDAVMHARLQVGDAAIMGSDVRPGDAPPRLDGFAIAIGLTDEAVAQRVFDGLAEGGEVQMPLQPTFRARRFGMLADRYGVAWMVNCE